MDPEVVELVEAMNLLPGITTTESCCGHGEHPFRIWFTLADLQALPPLLYYLAACHSGIYGWRCEVTTDCGMGPASFYVTSTEKGEEAYQEAGVIADLLRKHVEESP